MRSASSPGLFAVDVSRTPEDLLLGSGLGSRVTAPLPSPYQASVRSGQASPQLTATFALCLSQPLGIWGDWGESVGLQTFHQETKWLASTL